MSYDLFFRSRTPSKTISEQEFIQYFQNRPNYEVQNNQALYGNEDTGVYFSFEYEEQNYDEDNDGDEPKPEIEPLLPLAFNINYFRPHPFGLEAEPELQSFVRHFDLLVSDPQHSGMGDGEYSSTGFLSGWNGGNKFSYRAIMSHEDKPQVITMPTAMLEQTWRWNFTRRTKQAEIGEAAFVPKIFFFYENGTVLTGVAWGDGIPILLPKVDYVLVPRHDLAPKRWFRAAEDDLVFFRWKELEPLLQVYATNTDSPVAYKLFYDETPDELAELIRNKKVQTMGFNSQSFDQILDREMIEKGLMPPTTPANTSTPSPTPTPDRRSAFGPE